MQFFTGQHTHALDEKNRVAIPRKHLEVLRARNSGEAVFITRGLDGCLFLYTEQGYEQIAAQVNAGPLGAETTRDFQRLFYADTEHCPVDRNGRVLITPALKELAGIADKVVFVGAGQRIELWDPGVWAKQQSRTRPDYAKQAKDVLR
ncbi:MAG: division/cell wall cluster transcriptional repressor MraZ [Planctomycetota bacterium]